MRIGKKTGLFQGLDEGLDIGNFLRTEDDAHRGHGRYRVLLEAFRDDLTWLHQAFVNVGRRGARGDAVERGADVAPLTFDGVAEHAGGGMLVEKLFAPLGVGDDAALLGSSSGMSSTSRTSSEENFPTSGEYED